MGGRGIRDALFTEEQEMRIKEIVGEAIAAVERHRQERSLSLLEADVEFGISDYVLCKPNSRATNPPSAIKPHKAF